MNGHDAPRGWWSRHWIWAVPLGCLGIILVPVGCIAGLALFAFNAVQGSEPYTHALSTARDSDAIRQALGEPIEAGWMSSASIDLNDRSGSARLSIPLHGPGGSAILLVVAERRNGTWVYETLSVEVDATGERIDLLAGDGEAAAEPAAGLRGAPPRLAAA